MSNNIALKVQTLQGLSGKIREIIHYLKDVKEGKLPPNNKIIFLLQVRWALTIVNNKLVAELEFRGLDEGIFSQEQ